LSLAHARNRMLFELLPDLFPPFLTDTERSLWGLYYQEKNASHGDQ
jgi:hypothetical protein